MGYYLAGDYYRGGDLIADAKNWLGRYAGKSGVGFENFGATGLNVGQAFPPPGGEMLSSHSAGTAADTAALARQLAGKKRYRRMNPGNVRALRRSMRRVSSFARLARATITFTQRVRMKKRRRR